MRRWCDTCKDVVYDGVPGHIHPDPRAPKRHQHDWIPCDTFADNGELDETVQVCKSCGETQHNTQPE